jgi:UDP-N-acetyl-D-mannosaminuronic acid dehydrogenase
MHLPGAGVGGHCLPKDPWLLKYGIETYGSSNFEIRNSKFEMIPLARRINDGMPLHVVELIEEALEEAGVKLAGAKVAVLGVAYLEDSDDTRNTPAAALCSLLQARGAQVVAHDPYVREQDWVEAGGTGILLTRDLTAALMGADCAAIVTRHREYVALANQQSSKSAGGLAWMKKLMRAAVIVDGRHVFDAPACAQVGLIYRGIGKG